MHPERSMSASSSSSFTISIDACVSQYRSSPASSRKRSFAQRRWTSPASKATYPVQWQVDTPVGRFLASRGPGMHHVAFQVDDLRAELARLAAEGATLIDETPRCGLFGLQVAFVHPESTGGVLAELVSDE